jgi:hypothetical protein
MLTGSAHGEAGGAPDEAADRLWGLTERFWLAPAAERRALVDPGALLVLGGHPSFLAGEDLDANLGKEVPWTRVALDERRVVQPDPSLAILGYQVAADGEGIARYTALCTTSWRRDGRQWRLVQHQQARSG